MAQNDTEKRLKTGLIGEHLSHSYSPEIHAMLGDYEYRLIELSPDEVRPFLEARDFDAINVTIPYKQDVIPYLDRLSDTARRIGAVNTIVREQDNTLSGYNTDYDGLLDTINDLSISLAGKKVLILGSGGASKTAVAVATDLKASDVIVISRRGENHYGNLERHSDASVIINTTPVGMYPQNGKAPVSLALFPHLEAVIDLIYNPLRTALLMDAEVRGIPCQNGLLMLASQARRASELFCGNAIPREKCKRIAKAITRDAENIILIGMPGCGKTTLGKLLAAELGRPFTDADEVLAEAAGCSIPDIFKNEGEAGFRKRESAVLRDLGSKRAQVIATGGGCVTVAENYAHLHQNGTIVFLDTPPEGLATAGRPLSLSRSPEALYRERLPLYRQFADVTVPITRDINQNLKAIKEALK